MSVWPLQLARAVIQSNDSIKNEMHCVRNIID